MVEECRDPNPIPRYHGTHHELSMAIMCQKCIESIQNCKCQESEYPCMTCKNRRTLDKDEECKYCKNCGKSKIGTSCECFKICGVLEDFCLGCCHACKEASRECIGFHCQQLNCICCEDCKEYPCICGQHDEQNEKEHDASCQKGKCHESEYLCITCKDRGTLDKYGECTCCKNCGKSKIGNSGNSCECCEICGVLEGFCLEGCHACKEAPCECTCFHCQQPNCICCEDCKEYPSICGQHAEQNEEEHDASCQKCKRPRVTAA